MTRAAAPGSRVPGPALVLAAVLALSAGLPPAFAASPAAADRPGEAWDSVLLWDWYYPGEAPYEALKAAAAAAGSTDWLSQMLARGEKVPQASARDLAWALAAAAGEDPAQRERLRSLFRDEADEVQQRSKAEADTQALLGSLDALDRRIDEIDATYQRNNYYKGSELAASADVYSACRIDAPSGVAEGGAKASPLAGVSMQLNGTADKSTFILTLGYADSTDDDLWDMSSLMAGFNAAFSLLEPVLQGGMQLDLGAMNVKFSPLLLATPYPVDRDLFALDVTQAYRPPKELKDLDLTYPAAESALTGLHLQTAGLGGWWPFTNFEFVYAPSDNTFYRYYDAKFDVASVKGEYEVTQLGVVDDFKLYAVAEEAGSDSYALNADGPVAQAWNGQPMSAVAQHSDSWSLGTQLQLRSGTALFLEGAQSHYESNQGPIGAPSGQPEYENGSAALATLNQPLGLISTGLELGFASPEFTTTGHNAGGLQQGATTDTLIGTAELVPIPGTSGYYTQVRDPEVLDNNSRRAALKASWAGSFLSLGAYDGVVEQDVASGPYVQTGPYLEGESFNGYGWYRVFGQNYGAPPLPGSAQPAAQAANMGPDTNSQIFLWRYNSPTDGMAAAPNGAQGAVHWQQLSQPAYREAAYTVLLSRDGVGDDRVAADSVKDLNYLGGVFKVDFKSLFGLSRTLDLNCLAEDRDVSLRAGLPSFGAGNLFNQEFTVGYLRWAAGDNVTLLGMAGYEVWRTDQSYFPVLIQTQEEGLGADFKLDPWLSGLAISLRSSWMDNQDLNVGSRQFTLWTLSAAAALSY